MSRGRSAAATGYYSWPQWRRVEGSSQVEKRSRASPVSAWKFQPGLQPWQPRCGIGAPARRQGGNEPCVFTRNSIDSITGSTCTQGVCSPIPARRDRGSDRLREGAVGRVGGLPRRGQALPRWARRRLRVHVREMATPALGSRCRVIPANHRLLALVFRPKVWRKSAQGKRSAALGNERPVRRTPKVCRKGCGSCTPSVCKTLLVRNPGRRFACPGLVSARPSACRRR